MNAILQPLHPAGQLDAVPSKSAAHRLLICAALSESPSVIRCARINDDMEATVRCLNALGADIRYEAGVFRVTPIAKRPDHAVLDCGESGSTLRFLLPVVSALGISADFQMSGRLPSRPLSPLYEEMIAHGAVLDPQGSGPLSVSGKLRGGSYTMAGNVSSQFTTGLLLALSLLDEPSSITLTGKVESRPYIDLTLSVLRQYGGSPVEENGVFRITPVSFRAIPDVTVEGDWSGCAMILACGALSHGGITVRGLDTDSTQGDRAILPILAEFGAECRVSDDGITVRGGCLHGITVDAADIPDIVPPIAAVAAAAEGVTVIENCGRLRLKESDRLETVSSMLRSLGADVSIEGDSLRISGKNRLPGGITDSFGDHRIAMAAAVAAVVCENPVTIRNAEAVGKSYPTFFDDLRLLCGDNSITLTSETGGTL